MPAFVNNGPDIPEELLEAHEEGKVVFFCGAGISGPANLPDFKKLVLTTYTNLGNIPNNIQKAAIKAGQYDTAISLLENNIVGGREKVRNSISKTLTPTVINSKTIATHDALLTLAKNRDGKTRLITTNFDQLFEEAIKSKNQEIERFKAPFLPVPKNRWDGIVYLHGLLPPEPKNTDFDRLVLSSGDFGLAYLTERWAARFVSELFRNYTVCFIGYSISDPVLRYMMDALAADRLLGEATPKMFAFGSYSKGRKIQAEGEWLSKNVTPILYRKHKRHAYLHKTLHEWAKTYRDGVHGKEMIITQHASTPPLAPSRTDFVVGRVLWALTDPGAAEHFANLDPVPPLEWLEPLSEEQFKHRDLSRFGVVANSKEDMGMRFSILHRPTPYTLSPKMCVVANRPHVSSLDPVMVHLARWLTRHLNDPKLIIWLTNHGDHMHDTLFHFINNQLDRFDEMEAKGEQDSIDSILASAPKAIPSPLMRTLWRLFITGRLKSTSLHYDLYNCISRIKRDGLTPSLRMELRKNLTPFITLSAPYQIRMNESVPSEPLYIRDLVNWNLVLSSNHVHSALGEWLIKPESEVILLSMLQDFTMLLRDALDLVNELGYADSKHDLSYIHQPSISDHPQNSEHHDWTILIKLTRDAWLTTAKNDPQKAKYVAEGWWHQPYPLFKRLALFAALHHHVIPQDQALKWLLGDNCWWLWSRETQREAIRLLVTLAQRLNTSEVSDLEECILVGPPREMFTDNLEVEELEYHVDRTIWLHLAKFQTAGGEWTESASAKLDELIKKYPSWELSEDERQEFPSWMGPIDELHKFSRTPEQCSELVEWLKEHQSTDHRVEDDWSSRCGDDFTTTSCALLELAKENIWPYERWNQALLSWSEDKIAKKSWSHVGPFLSDAPDEVIQSFTHGLSWWLRTISKTFEGHEEHFLKLCRRIFELNNSDDGDSNDPVIQAINHPVGLVTEALLQLWYRMLEDGQSLPEELKIVFTKMCNT